MPFVSATASIVRRSFRIASMPKVARHAGRPPPPPARRLHHRQQRNSPWAGREAVVDTDELPMQLALTGETRDSRHAGKLLFRPDAGTMLLADRGY
jgi:hypothetical protein